MHAPWNAVGADSHPIHRMEVGARGIESVARNAGCTRLRAIVITGLTPTEIIKHVFNAEPDIMSPFAMTLSQAYERRLMENGGASLLTAYREKGHLAPSEVKISSVADHAPGDRLLARQRRELETQRLLDMKHAGHPLAPNLILNPRLPLALVGVTHAIELDYLVASDDASSYRVGVIKSYADRGGKTDKADIRAACREAAVGTLALRQHLESRGDDPDRAGDRIDMVLRAPGSFVPRLLMGKNAVKRMTLGVVLDLGPEAPNWQGIGNELNQMSVRLGLIASKPLIVVVWINQQMGEGCRPSQLIYEGTATAEQLFKYPNDGHENETLDDTIHHYFSDSLSREGLANFVVASAGDAASYLVQITKPSNNEGKELWRQHGLTPTCTHLIFASRAYRWSNPYSMRAIGIVSACSGHWARCFILIPLHSWLGPAVQTVEKQTKQWME